MSKLIYLCARPGMRMPLSRRDLEYLSTRLCPDNINPRSSLVLEGDDILVGVFNPVPDLPVHGYSVCLGAFFDNQTDWWQPGAKVPDGSYALFRGNGATVELVSDMVASRTIWYVKTDDLFIASTSQRAIVTCLGSYEPNDSTYPWMLSSGTLGPGLSWDRRIRSVPGDTRLVLDRRSWEIKLFQRPVEFKALELPQEEHERRLQEAIEETFAHIDIDLSHWILPLSGGYDSRAILLMLKDRTGLRAITWGLRSALKDQRSDAWVARKLAGYSGVPHEYFETDLSDEPIETLFQRFLVAGEGRTDHISGYMDGFAIWKYLYESDCRGVIRGDEAFGWQVASKISSVRRSLGMFVLSDYSNLNDVNMAVCQQEFPSRMNLARDETLETWRDRLYQVFRTQYVLAALNDLKCAYLEVINPLLSRRILEQVRLMPDSLRTEKRLFRNIVHRMSPKIPFADNSAIASSTDILRDLRVTECIRQVLGSDAARTLLSDYAVEFVMKNIQGGKGRGGRSRRGALKSHIKDIFPETLVVGIKGLRSKIQRESDHLDMDINILAFREYIIYKMNGMLREDASVALIDS